MQQESKVCKNGHQNTFLTIFTCFRLFFCVCRDSACVITYFKLFPSLRTHSWVPTCVFELTAHFQLVFNYFQLFLAVFFIYFHLLSLILFWFDFIHFWSYLFVFDCFYPNLSVTAYFHLFFNINFNYFHSFSTILDKNCFTPLSYSQTGSGQVRPTHLTWPLTQTLCGLGQAMKNLAWPWPF